MHNNSGLNERFTVCYTRKDNIIRKAIVVEITENPSVKLVSFEVRLNILDASALKEHARFVQGSEVLDMLEAVCEGVVNPITAPVNAGYEIQGKVAFQIDTDSYVLGVTCRVFNEEELIADARCSYESCFGDADWSPKNLEEALYEVLIASNDNPAPVDIGFELVQFIDHAEASP